MDPVVHFEIPYEDSGRICAFYKAVFGWETTELGPDMGNYVVATTAATDANADAKKGVINGGFFPKRPEWPAPYPSVVIAVADIESKMALIEERGGKVLGEPMLIPGVGRYVAFYDTEGSRLSILEPSRSSA